MTEQSLCKGCFKRYLLYRIKSQKANLILSVILNIFALPLFFMGQISGITDDYSTLYYFGTYFGIICGIFLIVLAVVGAVFSFEFYYRKNLTDTVGCLPLTYKQRFWGDLLAGYITNVAAVIPVGLITAAVMGADSRFGYITEYDYSGTLFQFMLSIAASLIFALTFIYLLSVLIISACGNILQSVLFSIFGIAALCGTAAGLGGCYASGMLGVNISGYMVKAASVVPPLGPINDLIHSIRFFSGGTFDFLDGSTWWWPGRGESFFSSVDVPHIVWFVILGAIITLGAYYVGKRRKTERTGSEFVIRPMFYVISSLFCTAGVLIVIAMLTNAKMSMGGKLSVAAVTGAIMCFVSVVMYLPKKKALPRCIICGIISIGASVGIAALIRGTGSFGAAYLPENAKEIEYIEVYKEYTITDKSDIKLFIKNHNDFLHDNLFNLTYGDWYSFNNIYTVEYKTTDGKTVTREYACLDENKEVTKYYNNNLRILPGYGRYFFEMLNTYLGLGSCNIIEENISYDITGQDFYELIETMSREAAEKYDPDAEIYAKARFWNSFNDRGTFYIGKNLEDTIALLERLRDTGAVEDPEELVLMIDFQSLGSNSSSMRIEIKNKDMDDPLVKVLIKLLRQDTDGSDDRDNNFQVLYYNPFSSSDKWSYYVPQENSAQVLEFMTELALRGYR